VVSGLCLLPSGAGMLALSPVSAMMTRRFGPRITLCTGSLVVAAGFVIRIVLTGQIWEIVAGTTVVGAGTGIAYAAMPTLIALGAPHSELAAANGLNSLARLVGSSIASAIGGTILASTVIVLGGVAFPSLAAYRILFALCAAAAVLGAIIALLVPRPPGYSPLVMVTAEPPQWRAGQVRVNGHNGTAQPAGSSLPAVPRPSSQDGTSA
jgi:MFS family permease